MILLKADPANPAQFFGACGFFELASFLTPGISACWKENGFHIDVDASLFGEVMHMLERLEIKLDADWDWSGNENVRVFDLIDEQTGFRLRMDWWESRDGTSNSLWKCFAARMKASKTTEEMLDLCVAKVGETSLDNLFELMEHASGRLGFDTRSAWDAGDVGFSPNEHDSIKAVATYPFAEFLASIALQTFPFQYEGNQGRYFTWGAQLPIALARAAATTGLLVTCGDWYVYKRVMRGQGISSLAYSRIGSFNKRLIRR